MRVEVIRCDVCKKAEERKEGGDDLFSDNWIWISARDEDDVHHLCSVSCFLAYARSLMGDLARFPQQEQPACKMRRFLLVNGETADITEGVRWPSGWVSVDPCNVRTPQWDDWDIFKRCHPGDGVQWIDQEVKSDSPPE